MSGEQNGAAGTAAPPTGSAAGGTGGQPDTDQIARLQADLETANRRFTGLQRTYQSEQQKWQADAAKAADLDAQLRDVLGQKESLAVQLADLQTKLTASQQQALQANQQHERLKVISTEFPTLLPLEAKGLLPSDAGDALKAKLTEMAELLKTMGGDAAAALVKGATPPAPPGGGGNGAQSPEVLFKQALEARRNGNMAEYDRLYSASIAARKGSTKN